MSDYFNAIFDRAIEITKKPVKPVDEETTSGAIAGAPQMLGVITPPSIDAETLTRKKKIITEATEEDIKGEVERLKNSIIIYLQKIVQPCVADVLAFHKNFRPIEYLPLNAVISMPAWSFNQLKHKLPDDLDKCRMILDLISDKKPVNFFEFDLGDYEYLCGGSMISKSTPGIGFQVTMNWRYQIEERLTFKNDELRDKVEAQINGSKLVGDLLYAKGGRFTPHQILTAALVADDFMREYNKKDKGAKAKHD